MIAAIGLAGVMLWFNDQLLPETNHRLKTLLIDVSRKSPTLQLEEPAVVQLLLSAGIMLPEVQRSHDEPVPNPPLRGGKHQEGTQPQPLP